MRTSKPLLFVIALLLSPYWVLAQVTASSGNASLTYHRTNNNRPLVLQWTVEGRGDIWVFPAGGSFTFNLHADHLHPGLHVGPHQIHVQGILDVPGVSGIQTGQVLAGAIYTVDGNTPEGDEPRISEKMEIINKSSIDIPLNVIGMGSNPSEDEYAGPPLTNLDSFQTMLGQSVMFAERVSGMGTVAETPFGPLTMGRFITFKGFNPPSSLKSVTLRAGETMTVLTELSIAPFQGPVTSPPTTTSTPAASSTTSPPTAPSTPTQ